MSILTGVAPFVSIAWANSNKINTDHGGVAFVVLVRLVVDAVVVVMAAAVVGSQGSNPA